MISESINTGVLHLGRAPAPLPHTRRPPNPAGPSKKKQKMVERKLIYEKTAEELEEETACNTPVLIVSLIKS